MSDFDAQVGLSYLRGMHLNDSKTPLGSKRDRHENIGMYVSKSVTPYSHMITAAHESLRIMSSGHIGLPAFQHILSDSRLQDIPLVLETPSFESTEIWTKEVEVLNQLSTMGDAGNDQVSIGKMKTEIEEMVKRVVGSTNTTAKNGKATKAKASGKRGRSIKQDDEPAEEDSDPDTHEH